LLPKRFREHGSEQVKVENQSDLDQPLVMRMGIDVSDFAHRRGRDLCCLAFAIHISKWRLANGARRRSCSGNRRTRKVRLSLKLPPMPKVISTLAPGEVENDDRKCGFTNRRRRTLVLERSSICRPEGSSLRLRGAAGFRNSGPTK